MLALECALVALVPIVLNSRDRRRDRAIAAIVGACPLSWRSSITLDVRAPLFSRGVKAVLDVSDCEPDDLWATMGRLTEALPSDVKLAVGARLNPTLTVAVSARTGDGSYLPPFSVMTGLRAIRDKRLS